MKTLTIKSDGTALGTSVLLEDGTDLTDYVNKIELECEAGDVWSGYIRMLMPKLDVTFDIENVDLDKIFIFEEEDYYSEEE